MRDHLSTFTTSRQDARPRVLPLLRSLSGRLQAALASEMTFTEVDGGAALAAPPPTEATGW